MGRRRKRLNKEVLSIHKKDSPKNNIKFLKKWVNALNSSCLIETLSYKQEKNLQLTCKTSESTSSLPKSNLFVEKYSPLSNTKTDEKIYDNQSGQLLNQTIDLCQEESSFNSSFSNNQPIEIPSKTENIAEVLDLSTDTSDQSEVILLKDTSGVGLNCNKICNAPVIDLSDDGDGQTENKNECKINDDIVVVKAFKNSAPPLKFTQSIAHSLSQNCVIKSLNNISNSSSLNYCNVKNNVKIQAKLKKSKKNRKKKLKFMLENHNKLNGGENWRHFKVSGLSQENLMPRLGSSEVGKNIYLSSPVSLPSSGLRPIIIDGSNVAMGNVHVKCRDFSCKKLEICINFFKNRGHKVTAFVPQFRIKFNKSDNPALLSKLVQDGDVILTPSKIVEGKCIVPYDDRFIVQTAVLKGGIIVTRDNYRDLLAENPAWAETINYRTLPFTWVDDLLMFPNDPLGEHGPCLDEFLKFH